MITKENLDVDRLKFFFMKREAVKFYEIFIKKDYGFSTEDFFILLRSHLLMVGYRLSKIDEYLNAININVQSLAQIIKNRNIDEQ